MIKEYRKTATIKAEQFDNSSKMVKKYKIKSVNYKVESSLLGLIAISTKKKKPVYFLDTLEGSFQVNYGDWIATGVNGEHWAIKDDIFKKTYAEVKQ